MPPLMVAGCPRGPAVAHRGITRPAAAARVVVPPTGRRFPRTSSSVAPRARSGQQLPGRDPHPSGDPSAAGRIAFACAEQPRLGGPCRHRTSAWQELVAFAHSCADRSFGQYGGSPTPESGSARIHGFPAGGRLRDSRLRQRNWGSMDPLRLRADRAATARRSHEEASRAPTASTDQTVESTSPRV